MDRSAWLEERRAAVEKDYSDDAPNYDAGYDPVTPVHRRFVERLVEATPADGVVLDAACGTGPYFAIVTGAGRRVVGADQSRGMLAAARAKHPDVGLQNVGLQELSFVREFDAVMCVDAMEHVPPEEGRHVLANLHRAARPGTHVYLTIETIDDAEIERAYAEATAGGLPAVRGELTGEDTGGYHYYPERQQVARWLEDEGLTVIADEDEALDGYGYRHLLLRSHPG